IGTVEDQSTDIFSLGEVVVSGTLNKIEAGEIVHVITDEDIVRSGARTLDEAISTLSDVNVRLGNEGIPRIDIRGFKSRQILLLVDGIPMNSSFDQQFDPSSIPVENIKKIKVISGASSVLYNQGGLGGVINIITKKGKSGLSGTVSAESGDGEQYLTQASLSGGKGKFDFFLSGSALQRDYIPLARSFNASLEEAAGYRKNSDRTRRNAHLNIGFTPNDNLYLALSATYSEGGYGKPASAINNKFDPYASPAKFGRVDNYLGYTFQLAMDYTASEALSVRTSLYYNRMEQDNNQYDNEYYNSFDDPNVPNSFQLRNNGITRGFSIKPSYDLGKAGTVTVAISGEWQTWEDSGQVKTGGDGGAQGGHGIGGGSPPYLLFPVSDHYDLFEISTAIEYNVMLSQQIGFAVGFAQNWQLKDEKDLSDYRVSTSLYYDLFKDTRLKAAFARNIRFPSLSQLYLRDTNNPNLNTERVYHYQIGIEQQLPLSSTLMIEGYRSDEYNFIALNQNVTPASNINFAHFRFTGFESSLKSRPLPKLSTRISYTLLKSEDLSDTGRDKAQYVPRDKLTFTGSYDFDFGLTPYLSVSYVANSYVYTKQKIATVGEHRMNDYTVVDVKLSQKILDDRFTLYVGALNLFNEDYEQSYGIPLPGRFIYGGVTYHFKL
ncbi:MAG: TonB-dependent receptor, partial [Geobacteraceae bacterium]|nr:TonB-dependent receptor [Geobacteraceae bacterium]